MNTATETLLAFWEEPRNIPFKGRLISEEPPNDGEEPTTCMCAQGQALHIVGGYTVDDLRNTKQATADKEVAKLLDISVSHSILLRKINDSQDGAPSDILTNPEKYLGKNYQAVLNFWLFLDSLTGYQWNEVYRRYSSLDSAAWYAARDAAGYAARVAAREAAAHAALAARDAAWDAAAHAALAASLAARVAAGDAALAARVAAADAALAAGNAASLAARVAAGDAALAAADVVGYATYELIGNIQDPVFVPMFDT